MSFDLAFYFGSLAMVLLRLEGERTGEVTGEI